MSNNNPLKDRWILDMIRRKYLIVNEDGFIYRCVKATANGELLSKEYRLVKVQTHKPSGRVYFNASWRGIRKSVLVNRVVALRFLPNPENHPQVNHVNGDKQDNSLKNLEWSSGSDNEKHAHSNGLKTGRGSQNSNAKLTASDVLEIRASSESVSALSARFSVGRSTIQNIIKRKSWIHL